MGLLVKIFKNSSDSEFKLAQDLVAIAVADGNISDVERQEIERVSKLGIGYLELVSLVLMTATRENFPGDIGCKTLKTFVNNAIDPKDRPLQKNIENLRDIFDIIAESVPQMQNIDKDRNAFIHAMTSALELLFENTFLSKEFQDMGIDFKRVLAEERERAIKRWLK